ncbi:DUF1801 domain-containing protein [Chitinivorax sp. PXF-14]|uniref:DUF1801 domain-containing protein n=1 Tax=Chitinivorax sp. PXF-14 TaxID=3230488 RepID=UPI003465BBB9
MWSHLLLYPAGRSAKPASSEADALLASFPPDIANLTGELRQALRRIDPGLQERIYAGWRGFGYRHAEAGYVCGLFPAAHRVKLGFEHGVALTDPAGRLRGEGSRVRYLELVPGDALPMGLLAAWVGEAVALRRGR